MFLRREIFELESIFQSNSDAPEQSAKCPATDGVSLEYFLSELSDEDSNSW